MSAILEEIAARHAGPDVACEIRIPPLESRGEDPPLVPASPSLYRALGILVQNATEFAATEVLLILDWDDRELSLAILDDGPGFDLARAIELGEPYKSFGAKRQRGAVPHLGLGLFIARSLLAGLDGRLAFSNRESGGAQVTVTWPRTNPAAPTAPAGAEIESDVGSEIRSKSP